MGCYTHQLQSVSQVAQQLYGDVHVGELSGLGLDLQETPRRQQGGSTAQGSDVGDAVFLKGDDTASIETAQRRCAVHTSAHGWGPGPQLLCMS